MTPEERQQVIQALEKAIGTCFTEQAYRKFMSDPDHFMAEALAIMRREREPVAYWNFREGFSHCMTDALDEAAKNGPAPLYKD